MRRSLPTLVACAGAIAGTLLWGRLRWSAAQGRARSALERSRRPAYPGTYDTNAERQVPAPVDRYLHAVLTNGQPLVDAVNIEHHWLFNVSENGERWLRFTSAQRVITSCPGFVWEGRIRLFPGLSVWARDAYIKGEGVLRATLFGVAPLADLRGTSDIAAGELMRFAAEAAWHPTTLLPRDGLTWESVDSQSARAVLTDRGIVVCILFRFGEDGLIESVHADARGRNVSGEVIPTPWEGRWSDYAIRDGMRIPLKGEVAWILPEGRRPYWRGRITNIDYEWVMESDKRR